MQNTAFLNNKMEYTADVKTYIIRYVHKLGFVTAYFCKVERGSQLKTTYCLVIYHPKIHLIKVLTNKASISKILSKMHRTINNG